MDKLRSIGKHSGESVLGYDGKDLQKRNVFSLEWKSEGVIDVVSRWNLWRNHTGRGGFGDISHTHPFNGPFSRTTRVSQYQKGKTNLDFTKARESECNGISWAICKSAPCSRQTTTPAHHHSSLFTGRMPFLPPNQQRQSTKGRHALEASPSPL